MAQPLSLGQALAANSIPVVLTAAQITTLTPPAAITGFATSAKQDTAQTNLSSIDSKFTTLNAKDFATETTLSTLNGKVTTCNTGAVVISTSALPSGASTSVLQTTGNVSLSSIDSKTPALGQALAATSVPVVLTAAQLSTLTPPAAITGFATSANQTTTNSSLSSIDTKLSSQATAANQTTLNAKFSGQGTMFRNAGANATLNIKSSAGTLLSFSCYNRNAASRFFQIWNSATTAASGTLVCSKLVPSNTEIIVGNEYLGLAGIACSNGIAFGFSTSKDTFTTAAAGDQSSEVIYI